MRLRWSSLALAGAAILVSGCVREARIAMPSDVRATTEPIELAGIGGWERGQFRLGESEGRFRRRAEQRTSDGFRIENVGAGRFEASGPELGGQLSATCGHHQEQFDAGAVVVSGARLAYGCAFTRDGRDGAGELLLAEVPTSGGLLAGITRAGEMRFGALRIGVRAIHDMEGGRLPSGTPLGYAFDIDGRQIGAVDLNGGTKTVHAPRVTGPERQAVLAASLALSIFWDPGE